MHTNPYTYCGIDKVLYLGHIIVDAVGICKGIPQSKQIAGRFDNLTHFHKPGVLSPLRSLCVRNKVNLVLLACENDLTKTLKNFIKAYSRYSIMINGVVLITA